MKKVLLFGATGMLGSAIYNVLKDKYDLILTVRNLEEIKLLEEFYGGTKNHIIEEFDVNNIYQDYFNRKGAPGEYFDNFLKKMGEVDGVINAIGITIPFSLKNPAETFFINSAFPFILANSFGSRLIHITTDCVYDGKIGAPYDENAIKNPLDIYGFSKALGEPSHCLTIRTSIVGRELTGKTGLLEWFLQQEGKTLNGFTKHFWNGITTKQFGIICDKIISQREKYPENGIYHVFSNIVSKYEMLVEFQKKYRVNCQINPDDTNSLDRTMKTIYPLCQSLEIPTFSQMIAEL